MEVKMDKEGVYESKDVLSLVNVSMTGSLIMVGDSHKSKSLEKVAIKQLETDLYSSGSSGKVPFDS